MSLRARIMRVLLTAAVLAAALMVGAPDANARLVLLDASTQRQDGVTRLTFRMSNTTDFRIQTLPEPHRLVIDLPPLDWAMAPAQLERVGGRTNGIAAVRYGWFRPGTYRIVLDLDEAIAITRADVSEVANAFALTVAWRGAEAFRVQKLGGYVDPPLPRPRPRTGKDFSQLAIVIDAGHGGVDPGAIGRSGSLEKNITLRASKMLAARLRESDRYKVIMTRTDDRFLRLRDRVAVARRADADLFVSLHADSAGSSHARGLSVYSLSQNASDAEAAALARRENRADLIGGVDLTAEQDEVVSILLDLAQRETMNKSVRFANRVVQAAATRVPLLTRAHRQAGFAVLKAPDVPSALIELGFLSNPAEERLLNSPDHLADVVEAIVGAIDSFFADDLASNG